MGLQGNNIMIDFETMGTDKDAVVLSVGITIFDEDDVLDTLYMEFDIAHQLQQGRTMTRSTIGWWSKTNKKEFGRLIQTGEATLDSFIMAMGKLMGKHRPASVWSRHPMDFDIVNHILGDNAFPFYMFKDCATFDVLQSMSRKNNHNALDDTINQVEHVQGVIRQWRSLHAQIVEKNEKKSGSAPSVTMKSSK